MSKVVVKKTRKMIINDTLKAFFSVGDEANKDGMSIPVDLVDVEILTDALEQALEKERNDENSNKFEQ